MPSFASVKAGSRTIDLHAFTGHVVDQQRSSVTEVTHHHPNNTMIGSSFSWQSVIAVRSMMRRLRECTSR